MEPACPACPEQRRRELGRKVEGRSRDRPASDAGLQPRVGEKSGLNLADQSRLRVEENAPDAVEWRNYADRVKRQNEKNAP